MEAWLRCCNYLFTWVAEGAPYIILAPAFFSKQIEYGIITQAAQAFNSILRGTTVIIRDLSYCTELKATATRLIDMVDAFDEKEGSKNSSKSKRKVGSKKYESLALLDSIDELSESEDGDDVEKEIEEKSNDSNMTRNDQGNLVVDNLCLSTPGSGHKLVQNLSLKVEQGSSLLIVGPSGVGKSSLLRAVCGLWEASTGQISMPGQDGVMFLPQNPYIPEIPLEVNTLKTQLLFPRVFANNTDAEIIAALEMVNLAHLMSEEGINSVDDWRKRLSGGEKQRLAMARLLLAAPKMAFLDESTSALDDDNEKLLYKSLQGNNSSYVSVGHRKELLKYHSHILELIPGGGWSIKESEFYRSCANLD